MGPIAWNGPVSQTIEFDGKHKRYVKLTDGTSYL